MAADVESRGAEALFFDLASAQRKVQSRVGWIVFVCLLSDFLLLSIVIPFVPQLLSKPPPQGIGVYSTTVIGLLFSIKPIVQIVVNPIAGLLTDHIGPRVPLLASVAVLTASTVCFAIGSSYAVLFAARAIQGAASAVTMTAGMTLLCELHHTKETRAEAMGHAMGGMALGVLTGPLLGGLLFHRFGQAAPMLFVAAILVISLGAQLNVMALERAISGHKRRSRSLSTSKISANSSMPNNAMMSVNPGAPATTHAHLDVNAERSISGLSDTVLRASLNASFLHAQAVEASHHALDSRSRSRSRSRSKSRSRSASGNIKPPVAAGPDSFGHSETLQAEGGGTLRKVFGDKMFLVISLAMVFANAVIGMLEPLFQIYVEEKFGLSANLRGVIWTASTFGYLVGTPIAGKLAAKYADNKSKLVAVGLLFMGLSLPLFAASPRSWNNSHALALTIAALVLVGMGMALVDVPCQPLLADVADFRALDGYGVVFAVADISASLGFTIGPLLGGALASLRNADLLKLQDGPPNSVNVEFPCIVFAMGCILCAPLLPVVLLQAEAATSTNEAGTDDSLSQESEIELQPETSSAADHE